MVPAVSPLTDEIKPRLRGWLHAGAFPIALAAGVVLVALSPTTPTRVSSSIYGITGALQFGISAVYHRGNWGRRTYGVLRRLDHANIFLLIAGSTTPFAVLLLEGQGGATLLSIVWIGALLGVLFRVGWASAPRWFFTPIYIALGWVAALYVPEIYAVGGAAVVALLVLGGTLYSVGGVIYALGRPNWSPRWFGYHELFHALTLAAFLAHYVSVSLLIHAA